MVSFRDFKDSGPLTVYFATDVEMKINQFFAGKMQRIIKAGNDILVYQEGLPVGLARAVAPAWEWPTTGGRLAKSHQRL